MSVIKARAYDKEFKLNVVKLYLNEGKSFHQLSKELGLPVSTLAGWVKKHKIDGIEAFPGKGYLKATDAELACLYKELRIVKEERDILKKVLGIFSVTSK